MQRDRSLRRIAGASGGSGSPRVYETGDGTLIVQGYCLDQSETTKLAVPAGETAVEVPLDLILTAAQSARSR